MRQVISDVRTDPRQLGLVAVLALVAAAIAVVPLWRLTAPNVATDIIPHAQLAVEFVASGNVLTYSLWYPLIWLATAGGNPELFRISSVVLLSVFVVIKVLVAFLIAQDIRPHMLSSAAIAFGLGFFGPLVDPAAPRDIYLGQFSATVWHNSTNIMVAPFALIAFWAAMRLLRKPALLLALVAGVSCMVAVLVKPNFAIALIPVVGIVLLIRLVRDRTPLLRSLAIIALAALPPIVTLVAQYAAIYGGGLEREESLTVAPFGVWHLFSNNLPLSALLSFLGVVVALAILAIYRAIPDGLWVAWLVLGVTVVQAVVLAEQLPNGDIAPSGNWFWGAYTALMVVAFYSLLSLRELVARALTPARRIASIVAIAALSAHVVTGLYYALVAGSASYGAF